MKKIISLVAAAAMMLTASATVFAAKTYPANSEAPKMTAHYEKISEADGWSKVAVTFDLDDLGDLTATTSGRNNSGLKLASIAVNVATNSQVDISLITETGTVPEALSNINFANEAAFGQSVITNDLSGINILATTTAVGAAYPKSSAENPSVTANSLDNAFTLTFETDATEVTLSDAIISYLLFTNGKLDEAGNQNADRAVTIVNPTWTIGDDCDCDECNPPVEEKELELTIAEGTIYENGTVWACEIANAKDGLAKLEATFKAGEATKSVITTKLGAWGGVGATEFNIGINTSKAGVVANAIEATITDGTGATATDSASAVAAN